MHRVAVASDTRLIVVINGGTLDAGAGNFSVDLWVHTPEIRRESRFVDRQSARARIISRAARIGGGYHLAGSFRATRNRRTGLGREMKIRLKGNSIRLRLGPRDIQKLLRERRIVESTRFTPTAVFEVSLAMSIDVQSPLARLDDRSIRIVLPATTVDRWAESTEQIAITADHPVGDGQTLKLLIEKDFECLDARRGTEAEDSFPNPKGGAAC